MHYDSIDDLRHRIKRTFERYKGEKTDGKATLEDVAKFFNIPIDKARCEDYVVSKMDYDIPAIEIKDQKNNISYTATYTGKADLLNYNGPMQFNHIVSVSPIRKEESLYYIGSKTPIVTRMTFTDGEYDLVFEREMENSVGLFGSDGNRMTVRYLQHVNSKGRTVKQSLLTKNYRQEFKEENIPHTFEQTYTYGMPRYIKWEDSQDKYTYLENDSVIYGINTLKQKGLCDNLCGICFEDTHLSFHDYFPYHIDSIFYPELNHDAIKSAMIFQMSTENFNAEHSLQVYKSDVIGVTYRSRKYLYPLEGDYEKYNLPKLSDGTISSDEIQNVIASLKEKLGDSATLEILSNELSTFGKKIDIRKGLVQEEPDPLSPKQFIDKSFDEICSMVSENKEDYFILIKEQFETEANISGKQDKGQAKVYMSPKVVK